MAQKIQAFLLSGRLEIDAKAAHKDLKLAEAEAKSLTKSVEQSSVSFKGLKQAAESQAKSTRQTLAQSLLEGKRNIGGLVQEARAAQKDFEKLEKAEAKALKLTSGGGGFKSLLGGLSGGSGDSGGGLLGGLASGLQLLPGLSVVTGALGSVAGAMKSGVGVGFDYNRMLEENKIAFEVMLGSADKAQSHLKELAKFAETSPFTFPEVVQSSKRLQAMGFTAESIVRTLRIVNDTAAATGAGSEGLDRITLALGQINTKGRVMAQEMNQLTEAGIPAWKLLGDQIALVDKKFAKLGDDERSAQVMKLVEQGAIKGAPAVEALLRGLDKRFGGLGERFANETASGLESNMSDVTNRLAGTATQNLFGGYKDVLRTGLAGLNGAAMEGAAQKINGGSGVAINTVEGFTKSIQDRFPAILETGKGIGAAAMQGTKEKLGIESPSTVFAAYGGFAVEGFAYGKDGKGGLASAESKAKLISALEELLEDPRIKAMLATLRFSEGAGYGTKVGGKQHDVTGLKDTSIVHVGRDKRGKELYSSADGGYQIINKTEKGLQRALGQLPFDEHGQDLRAVYLMIQRGAIEPLLRGDLLRAVQDLNKEWASLPGSPYGQGTRSFSSISRVYKNALNSGGEAGAPTSADNAYFSSKMLVRPRLREDYNAGRDPFMRPNITIPNPFSDLKKTLVDTVPVIVNVRDTFTGSLVELTSDVSTLATRIDEKPLKIVPAALNDLSKSAQTAEAPIKGLIKTLSFADTLRGAVNQSAGFLPSQQVGKKRGFFSKLLGGVAPFLQFIPGFGPIASQLASIASSAIGGDYGGALSGTAGLNLHAKAATFGGKRAFGGPVSKGRAYIVGDGGREEVFIPNQDGTIHPDANRFRRGASSGGNSAYQHMMLAALDNLQAHTARVGHHLARIESTSPGDVFVAGAKARPHAAADAMMTAMDRNAAYSEGLGRRMRV
jgi:tape measure domain-containing protein